MAGPPVPRSYVAGSTFTYGTGTPSAVFVVSPNTARSYQSYVNFVTEQWSGPSTFNPLDKKDGNVALSNNNLTITGNGAANNWARSSRAKTGKRYVEFTITKVANTIVGISGGGAIATYPGADANSFGMFSNGSGSINNTFPFWGPAFTTGDVVGMAVDFTAKLVWFRKNGGAWNGTSGDPTAGTGGNSIAAYTGTTHYVVGSEDSTGVLIGNFGATAFQSPAPAGYLSWDGTPNVSVNVTSTALAISAGSVSVNAKQSVSTTVTGAGLAMTAGTVTVDAATGGGTVTGQHIHPDGPYTGSENNDGGIDLNLGFAFCAFAPITITGIRFWKTSIDANTSRNVAIFNPSGTSVASGTSSGEPVGVAQWVTVPISPPLVMTGAGLGSSYTAAAQFPGQHYSATANYYDIGKYSADGKAYALADSESLANTGTGNGCFEYGNNVLTKPGGTFNKGDYWIDVEYSYSTGGDTGVSVNVTGAALTTSPGTVTVSGKATTSVTGAALVTAAGTVTVATAGAVNVLVAGAALAASAGTVAVTAIAGASVPVSGQQLTANAGVAVVPMPVSVEVLGDYAVVGDGRVDVTVTAVVRPAGAAMAASAGAVTVVGSANVNVAGTGVNATAGTVSAKIAQKAFAAGQQLTISKGTQSVVTVIKGGVKIWDGTKWVALPVKAWNGSAWVQKPMKTWTGSAWVTK